MALEQQQEQQFIMELRQFVLNLKAKLGPNSEEYHKFKQLCKASVK